MNLGFFSLAQVPNKYFAINLFLLSKATTNQLIKKQGIDSSSIEAMEIETVTPGKIFPTKGFTTFMTNG
jgi:hypothetical protein